MIETLESGLLVSVLGHGSVKLDQRDLQCNEQANKRNNGRGTLVDKEGLSYSGESRTRLANCIVTVLAFQSVQR
jgi:hypothetical protein